MIVVISLPDVSAAFKRLIHRKAAGPDGIDNTFYREHADAVVLIIAVLHQMAYVQCVPGVF